MKVYSVTHLCMMQTPVLCGENRRGINVDGCKQAAALRTHHLFVNLCLLNLEC